MVLGRAEIALELAFFPFPIELGRIPSEIPEVVTIGEKIQKLEGLEITQVPRSRRGRSGRTSEGRNPSYQREEKP